ncbi:PREDICTED: uncharacterized protein LOC104588724 [Nelumbo nucifera]|uniref:Uncharacterized protein LOC104588724 n=1 Tax=Nelumbo nucifera TaxID=4432 RepID=A0A1U7ZB91_NELNU|nr:PREDICTED: uncharacterized protein LOC104588724 [Nelumbo nucifera]
MAPAIFSFLGNLWPFARWKLDSRPDDVKASDRIVRGLSIPEQTKQFVFAIREPESQSIIYILAAEKLSEQSATDAECLIKEVRPDVVVSQVSLLDPTEIEDEEKILRDDIANSVPTSTFGVLKGCFVNKFNKEKYEKLARSLVLQEIFGVGVHGHFLAAKRAAKEVGSSVLLLESPLGDASEASSTEPDVGKMFQARALQSSSLVPRRAVSFVSSSSKRLSSHASDVQTQRVKPIASSLAFSTSDSSVSGSISDVGSGDCQLGCNYQAPSFAQSIYVFLSDLHCIFIDIPSVRRALAHAQKMLFNVDNGQNVDAKLLSEVHSFRVAVESLRLCNSNAGRCTTNLLQNPNSVKTDFSELTIEDKSHALLAQTLRGQTKKFRSIVAIVDSSSLAGLRKHWNTPVPQEIEDLAEQFFKRLDNEGNFYSSENMERRKLLADKPVVAVGAGATAVLGVSSLSKVVPASTFVKLLTLKVPASLKLFFAQTQKAVAITFTKTVGPSKVVIPGFAGSGAKTTSAMKATASADKIHAVAHSFVTYAQRTSLSAMRTAFYEIMRKRRVQSFRGMPWATFMCSAAMCTGLLVCGDGIECAAETLPAAPSIARLGCGLQSLHQASQAVRAGRQCANTGNHSVHDLHV